MGKKELALRNALPFKGTLCRKHQERKTLEFIELLTEAVYEQNTLDNLLLI